MKQQRREHLTGVYKSHFSQKNKTQQKKQIESNCSKQLSGRQRRAFKCVCAKRHVSLWSSLLYSAPSSLVFLLLFFFVFISLLRLFSFTVGKEVKDFKAQPFLKMHVVSGFSRLREKKNVTFSFCCCCCSKQSWEVKKKKYPKKCQWKGCRHPCTKICCLAVTAQCFSI